VGGEAAKSCSACETSTETTKVVSPPTFYFSIGAGLPPLFPLLSGGDEGGGENRCRTTSPVSPPFRRG